MTSRPRDKASHHLRAGTRKLGPAGPDIQAHALSLIVTTFRDWWATFPLLFGVLPSPPPTDVPDVTVPSTRVHGWRKEKAAPSRCSHRSGGK